MVDRGLLAEREVYLRVTRTTFLVVLFPGVLVIVDSVCGLADY